MKLESSDGALVTLRPERYQFGAGASTRDRDWDANWLVVRGDVRIEDGREWSFSDACLTTWEAPSLGAWLTGAASGVVPVVPVQREFSESTTETFTEPNIGFSVAY
ncbi:MAG: hypothetical protein QOE62_1955 [Actinomycetota bacterium]|nr:hypothetical protein [Actinomycetota bacterium]